MVQEEQLAEGSCEALTSQKLLFPVLALHGEELMSQYLSGAKNRGKSEKVRKFYLLSPFSTATSLKCSSGISGFLPTG